MSIPNFAADQLKSFTERVERLEEEKKGIQDDIKDVFAEAKANGFDPKTMKKCIRLRAMETHKRQEEDALLDTYRAALGIDDFERTPLGSAVADQAESLQELVDETGASITIEIGDGKVIGEIKPKRGRGRPKTVRDPSDGGLVTIPPKEPAVG